MANNQFSFQSDEERFMSHVAILSNGCWEWMGCTRDGYARFSTGSRRHTKRWQAHRWAYEHWVGTIPRGADLDHTCHKKDKCLAGDECPHRRCVNPMHMEPVSHIINVRRGRSGMAQRERTHCPSGHEYNESNTLIHTRPGGGTNRICRTCCNERTKSRYRAQSDHEVIPHDEKTHCPKGHSYDEGNTIFFTTKAGGTGRRCRACHIAGIRSWRLTDSGRRNMKGPYRSMTGKQDEDIVPMKDRTRCPQNHPYTPENTIVVKTNAGTGRGRACRICKNDKARADRASKKKCQLKPDWAGLNLKE